MPLSIDLKEQQPSAEARAPETRECEECGQQVPLTEFAFLGKVRRGPNAVRGDKCRRCIRIASYKAQHESDKRKAIAARFDAQVERVLSGIVRGPGRHYKLSKQEQLEARLSKAIREMGEERRVSPAEWNVLCENYSERYMWFDQRGALDVWARVEGKA